MTPKVTFAELRRFLEGLGFETRRRPPQFLLEHVASDTWFVFRGYRPREVVSPGDVAKVQFMLDQRGLVEQADFEQALMTAKA